MPTLLILPACSRCVDAGRLQPFTVEIREGGVYRLTCPNQHNQVVRLQHRPFEVLFEMGVLALLDGYYREAVFDFVAALERFLELYVRFVCFKHGLEMKHVDETWKGIARQSERQLGAFLFLYALDHEMPAKYVSDWAVKFRNDVVHNGYIPSREGTLRYGNEVLCYIRPILRDLKTRQNELMMRFIGQELGRFEVEPVTLGVVFETILSHAYAERPVDSMSLDEVLRVYPDFIASRSDARSSGFVLAVSR